MNDLARMIIDRRRRGDYRRDYRNDYNDYNDYSDYRRDGRRDYRDRRDRRDRDMMHEDYRDYRDYRDYNYDYADESIRLSKSDMKEWKKNLENADGTMGEHFQKEQIEDIAEKLGIHYKGYDENELCMTVNMLYSDYCDALKMYIPPEKEAIAYVKMAKAFLEDTDAPEGWEKLSIYYNCIVKDGE